MNAVPPTFREQVLLYLLRALWGMITPDVRAVRASWANGRAAATFVYDHPVTEAEWDVVREVETEVIADFPPDVPTDFTAVFLPDGQLPALQPDSWWVYVRRETSD